MITVSEELVTSRFSPDRPTPTSPESPDADSSPVETTVAMPSATIRFWSVGLVPSSIEETSVPGSSRKIKPRPISASCKTMSATTRIAIRLERVLEKPRIFRTAT